MEEMNHFAHQEHPLKLIENWNEGGDDEENRDVVRCFACEEPISLSGSAAYGCIECRFFLHKSCAHLPLTINFPSIYQHPLILINMRTQSTAFGCDVCFLECLTHGLCYSPDDEADTFTACLSCCVVELAHKSEADAIKEEAMVKLKHKGHPQHNLTLQLRPGAILCDACHTKEEGLFYQCDSCDFWIHKGCTTLAPTLNLPHHPKHSLVLIYSLPDHFFNFSQSCEFCKKYIRRNEWLYHCANCRYFTHIKCALNAGPPTPPEDPSTSAANEDTNDLLHFPMSVPFMDPLKLLHLKQLSLDNNDEVEITHPSHDHSLILTVKPQDNSIPDVSDPIEVCYVCVRPLSFPYYRCCKEGCSFTLHKYCANLPLTLQHLLHPHHTLDLVDTSEHKYFYKCTGCYSYGNTFEYKCENNCNFYLCVNCAFLPNTIKHISHEHPLIQLIEPNRVCKACDGRYKGISYACKACDFQLDMYCAMRSPLSLGHRFCRGHEIPLTYPPVEDHPEDFYCDICEMEMHPKRPLYHCHDCKNSFHLDCLSPDDCYENFFYKGTETVSYHKHPLTYVRRQKGTPQYVCSTCNCDINGILILECRSKICNFNICFRCHRKKIRRQ